MSRFIAVANQKGGVGKTTTSINLAAYLALAGRRTVLIDMDPQGNATSGVGLDRNDAQSGSMYDVMIEKEHFAGIIKPGPIDNLHIAPSDRRLAGAEVELVGVQQRELVLKQALEQAGSQFDYMIVDCPPSLGILTINALCAADSVLVPLQCEYYALEGISSLLESIDRVRFSLNPELSIEGILLTMFDPRTNLSDQVADEVRRFFRDQVFETMIPRNVRLSEAPSHGLPVSMYDSLCKGAFAYQALAREIMSREIQGIR